MLLLGNIRSIMRICIVNRPSCPSLEGESLPYTQALNPYHGARDVTALRCSEPLRYKVVGPKRSTPYFAGWDRLGIAVYSLQLIVYSLYPENLMITCRFLVNCLVVSRKKRNFAVRY